MYSSLKVDIKARIGFELISFDAAVRHFNHNATGTPPQISAKTTKPTPSTSLTIASYLVFPLTNRMFIFY